MSRAFTTLLLTALLLPPTPSEVVAADSIDDCIAATYKIVNKDSTATCFVVVRGKDPILVTAAHVLEQMSGDVSVIVLRAKAADGRFARHEVPLSIRSDGKPRWVRHAEVDVAAMPLTLRDDAPIAAIDFDQLADASAIEEGKLRTAEEVWMPCYPAQLESNRAGFPILRRGTVASFPLLPPKHEDTYLVDYRTFGGDSGAPVIVHRHKAEAGEDKKDARPLVVGLVIGKHRETTRSVTPIEERTVHRSLGLGIVVHAEFIRQTIAKLPR